MRNPQRKGGGVNVNQMELRRAALAPYGSNFTTSIGIIKNAETFESATDFTADTLRTTLKWIRFNHGINSSDITHSVYNSDSGKAVAVSDFDVSEIGYIKLWFPESMTQNIRVVVTG